MKFNEKNKQRARVEVAKRQTGLRHVGQKTEIEILHSVDEQLVELVIEMLLTRKKKNSVYLSVCVCPCVRNRLGWTEWMSRFCC